MSAKDPDYLIGRSTTCYQFIPGYHKRTFCEGCRTHVYLKVKPKTNKGWRCINCRSPKQAAAGSPVDG